MEIRKATIKDLKAIWLWGLQEHDGILIKIDKCNG